MAFKMHSFQKHAMLISIFYPSYMLMLRILYLIYEENLKAYHRPEYFILSSPFC